MDRNSPTAAMLRGARPLGACAPPRTGAFLRAAFAAAVLSLSAGAARANVLISIDKSTQQMTVSVDGMPRYRWFDGPRRLWHAQRHVSAAANGKDVVLETVLQLAHAIFDLLPRRLRDPWQLRDPSPRRPRFPRLYQTASCECRHAVRPGQAEGNERHDHRGLGRLPVV